MNIHVENPVIEGIVREAITKFCLREGIAMPANGDDSVTAWQIANHFVDYLYKSSDTLELDVWKGLYLKSESYDPTNKTARFAIMWQTDAEMFGHRTEVYAKIGTYGHTFVPQYITPEFIASATDTIMSGNENTPSWWQLVSRNEYPCE